MKHSFPHITVRWEDHWCTESNEPYSVEEIAKMAKATVRETTGYLVYEGERVLAIAGTIEEDGQVTEVNFFMKQAIISRSDKWQKHRLTKT